MTAPATPALNRPNGPSPARWGPGRIIVLVLAILALVAGLALVVGGGALAFAAAGREDGYYATGNAPLRSDGYAVSVTEIGVDVRVPDFVTAGDALGQVRILASGTSKPVFVGIGPSDDIARYLDGVRHDEVQDFDIDPFGATYLSHGGGAPVKSPDQQTMWAASDVGTGTREIVWNAAPGEWSIVIMNADGSAGVDASVAVGATLPVLGQVGVTMLVMALAALVLGTVLLIVVARSRASSPYVVIPAVPGP